MDLQFFPTWFCGMVDRSLDVHDHTCATVDTGCQRLAIGNQTLHNFCSQLPGQLKITLHPEINRFKSVHQTSTTTRVASIPCSLGVKGSLLRPAVFEDEHSQHAPFLLSLSFLIHCHGELILSPEKGLRIRIRGEREEIPLHLGPTGALRIPLQRFNTTKIQNLRKRQEDRLKKEVTEFEVLNLMTKSQPQVETNEECSRRNGAPFPVSSRPVASHGAQCQRQESQRRSVSPGAGEPLGQDGALLDPDLHPEGPASQSRTMAGSRDGNPGREDHRCDINRRPHLHPEPSRCGDSRSEEPYFGWRVQHGDIAGDTNTCHSDARNTSIRADAGSSATTSVSYTIEDIGGVERGINASGRSDLRGRGLGGDLRQDSTLRMPTGSKVAPLPKAGGQLQPHLFQVSPEDRPPVQVLSMDDCTTIPTTGTMARTRGGMAKPDDDERDAHGDGATDVSTPHHDTSRNQRLLREGDLQDMQETAEEPTTSRSCDLKQGDNRGRLQGISAVSEVEAAGQAGQEGLELKPLPPRMERKIRAALKKAVSFWKQIQGILVSCGNDDVPIAGLLQKFNQEICDELKENPRGSKRSHEIAEIMGLTHQQLRTVAEIYNPGCFQKMALRHNLEPGKVFDITLGHDLNDIRKRQEVKQYIQTMRPGLVLLAPPCRMYSQLQNLLKGLREEDSEVMDRY